MSDEELCKALRSALWGQGHHINIKAADRIEQLERDQKQNGEDYCALMEKHDALHVKLTKAVKMGNAMASFIRSHYIVSVAADWEDMVAELEKQNDCQ
jgi:hypothetical protein